jgi:DNA modification methylase
MNRVETIAEGVTVHLGDCREILPTLGQLDAIVTDPPYGINENSKKVASRGKLATPKDYGDFEWDKEPPPAWLIAMLRDVSRYQVIFGGNYYDLPPTSCWLVWDKKNGTNDFADCELAWTNLQKATRRVEWLWNGMIRKGSDVRKHPTQKPLGVMAWALDQLPDDVRQICDPFMGSGTTGVAAIQKGLQFTGIEREATYFDAACQRFTARYWIKQAASGKVPGAWQPSGPGGAWLFDHAEFVAWRKASKREVATCPRYTVEAKSIGRAPSVRVESSAEASRQRIDQLLRSVLGNGSTNSTRPPGGTSRGGRSARLPRNSSANT